MDEKLNERDRNQQKLYIVNPSTIQKHKDDIALATDKWKLLANEIKADIDKFNARTPDHRVSVSATSEIILLYWNNPPRDALTISRKASETTANYAAPDNPEIRKAHEGTINLLTDDPEKLSESLLSPVLFL
jgi:hypothetical protein